MADATQEMVALARQLFADHKGWGNNAPFWNDLRKGLDSGVFDREPELRIALAAIQATTERAANLAVEWRNECKAGVADGDQSTAAYQVRGAAIMTSEDRKQLSEIGYQVIDAKNEHVEKGWIVRVPNDDERVLIAASEGEAWDAARDHHASMTSEVTQADRDAAAEWLWDPESVSWDRRDFDKMKSGSWDDHSLIQAFANHRLTAQSGEGRSGAGDGFEAEQDGDAFTIRFPDGHAITAWRTGRLVVTKSEAGFDPFAIDIAALNARQSGEGERE